MRNVINYYYNLNPNKINQIFDYYYFYINSELYFFKIYYRNIEDARDIYLLNQEMLKKNIMVNEIISNRDGDIITFVNQNPYILTKISININKSISLAEISFLSNVRVIYQDRLMRSNWANLWVNKIDYLEYYHEQNYHKYPLLSSSFDYFIGLSENAITYLNHTISTLRPSQYDIGVISHEILLIDDTIYSLYDSQNIIIDHKARDIAEYIKMSFFRDNYSIFDELDEYFKYNYYSKYGIQLLLSRVLYPSFYFEMYDKIVNKKENESDVLKITSRIDEYEKYLSDIWKYFHKYYDIQDILWFLYK